MYKHILVATDGSVHAQVAVEAACELAERLGAKLSIIHVMGEGEVPDSVRHLIDSEHLAPVPEIEVRSVLDIGAGAGYMRTIGETGIRRHQMWSALAQHVIREAKGHAEAHNVKDVSTSIEEGDPVEVLMGAIEDSKPDLVVLGRRGVSDMQGLLMGSVSHKIGHLADCHVLTVK